MHANKRAGGARSRNAGKGLAIAALIVATGMAAPGGLLMQPAQGRTVIAQQTQTPLQISPLQISPPQISPAVPAGKQNGPADAKPGGTRPTTPAPEPAQPDADARKAGAQPALPAAPAEKTAPPIREK
jgi:hypothetical protein